MKILVTGATGKQGVATTRVLLARGHHVRAMTRKRESPAAERLANAGAEVVVGDFRERETLTAAMQGVDAVFAMSTFFEEGAAAEVEQGKALVDAASTVGVAYLVYTSVAGADRQTGIPHFDSKYEIEQHLASTGIPHSVIAPTSFMENLFLPQVLDGLRHGILAVPLPADRKLQQTAVDDIGRFAALVIEQRESMLDKRIELASDERSGAEQAAILSEVLGREIGYQEVPLDAVRQQSEDLAVMYAWIDRVGFAADVTDLRQRYPEVGWHTLADWAHQRDWSALAAR